MGKLYDELSPKLINFMKAQKMFFVGTAPHSLEAHVNISPKGLDCFRVLDSKTVAYLDVTGSGVETISHVKENRRLVIMFCAFQGKPFILRLHGKGTVIESHQPEFNTLVSLFPKVDAARVVIKLDVLRIADSCGWTVPLYKYSGTRNSYQNFTNKIGVEGIRAGQLANNMESIDGLPGLSKPSL